MTADLPSLSPCDALIAVMVAVSASDTDIRTSELVAINRIVNHTPVFAKYDIDRIRGIAQVALTLLAEEGGLAALLGLVRDALPRHLFDTAYVLICDVAASDGRLANAEAAFLAEFRAVFCIDRLHAAAIEMAARARQRVL